MGILCSSVDKEEDDTKNIVRIPTLPPKSPRRLHKIPQTRGSLTRSNPRSNWRDAVRERTFDNAEEYNAALKSLQIAEQSTAFDHEAYAQASPIEHLAMNIVRMIRASEQKGIGSTKDVSSQPERMSSRHFLGNIDQINQSELLKIARRLPKGAHLHVHFNSCLPASFLIQQARNIDAMYIRSTEPLTTPRNWTNSRISFMVMTRHEATHEKGVNGLEYEVPLADLFAVDYLPNRWMPYKDFQMKFKYYDDDHNLLKGTIGAETWLERKMIISEEEAHGTQQTGTG